MTTLKDKEMKIMTYERFRANVFVRLWHDLVWYCKICCKDVVSAFCLMALMFIMVIIAISFC